MKEKASGNLLCFVFRSTQVRPVDIGSQFFASNSAVRCTLNIRTALSGNAGLYPLLDHLIISNVKHSCHGRETTHQANSPFDRENIFHGRSLYKKF